MDVCLYSCFSYAICKPHLSCAVLYFCLWPVCLYHMLSHYLVNGRIFSQNVIKHKTCVLIFPTTLPEIFLILRRIKRNIIINVHRVSCKILAIPVRF
jgi:hypothetical protein